MKKSTDERRRASVEAMLARQDIGELMLQKIMRLDSSQPKTQVDVLAQWARDAFGRDAAQAFDRLNPSQVGRLLSSILKSAEGANFHICAADSAMQTALGVKP
jgi:hypothetical protein